MSADADNDILVIDQWCELHRIDGVWNEVRFGLHTGAALTLSVFDTVRRRHVWAGARYAKSCRPLTDGELVAHGLKNN